MIVEGDVAFSNVTKHESYMGQSTNSYTVTVTLNDSEAKKLAEKGVKLKDYEGTMQRKFRSKYDIRVVDTEDGVFTGEIPRGSKVRLSVKLGDEHPVHGVGTYVSAIRVLEAAEDTMGLEEGF